MFGSARRRETLEICQAFTIVTAWHISKKTPPRYHAPSVSPEFPNASRNRNFAWQPTLLLITL